MNYYCSYSKIDNKLTGEKINELLISKSIDVKCLANTIGVSNQAVYNWLNGKTLPTLENLFQISRILHVSMDEMIIGTTPYSYELPEIYVRDSN